MRDAGGLREGRARGLGIAERHREDRFLAGLAGAGALDRVGDRPGHRAGIGPDRGDVDRQHRVARPVGEQRFQGGREGRAAGIDAEVDRVAAARPSISGICARMPDARSAGRRREADAAAVGQDRRRSPGNGRWRPSASTPRTSRRDPARPAGRPAGRPRIDRVGPGGRARRYGSRRPGCRGGAGRRASNHGLGAGGRPGRDMNRRASATGRGRAGSPGPVIGGEIVEAVGHADIEDAAERQHRGEEAVPCRAAHSTMAPPPCRIARPARGPPPPGRGRTGGIELGAGHARPALSGPRRRSPCARAIRCATGRDRPPAAEPGGEDHGRPGADRGGLGDHLGHARRRHPRSARDPAPS